jgi:uncharacterized protein (TIGR02271 family)
MSQTDLSELSDALARAGDAAAVVPVIAEQLQVGRRSVETGRVRLTKLVREEQETIDPPVLAEEVVVERVPINQFVSGPVQARQEGDTLILPVLEEVVVVERRLMLREEVRISKRVKETREPETVTLRREEIRIERTPNASGDEGT